MDCENGRRPEGNRAHTLLTGIPDVNGITRHRRIAIVAAGTLIFLLGTMLYKTSACPFCLSPPQTLAEQISRADITLIAELVRFRVYDSGTRPESVLRIREFLQGESIAATRRELAIGQSLVIAAEATGKPGDLFLMYGTLPVNSAQMASSTFASDDVLTADGMPPENSGSSNSVVTADLKIDPLVPSGGEIQKASLIVPEWISWNETLAITSQTVRYLKQMPANSCPQKERLEYFIPFLEHADALIAIDAWAEFGNSSYNDVVSNRDLLPREKLRAWIADPQMSPERLGLYGMMLGLCGAAEDSNFLLEQMREKSEASDTNTGLSQMRFRFGSEGLMGGYLLLTGAPGLDQLEKTILVPDGVPDTACHALIQALQFMWSYENDVISPDRICKTMRLMLSRESMREIAITNLSRWEDWSTLPVLAQMFDGECSGDRSTQRAIIQFAQTCMKNPAANSGEQPVAHDAEMFLCHVQATRPDLLTSNRRDFQSPQ